MRITEAVSSGCRGRVTGAGARIRRALAVLVLVTAVGCGAPPSVRPAPGPAGHAVIRVPEHAPSIQQAVDSARPGDLVLVHPGVYRESVVVRTPSVVLRGTDRNTTVIDGEFRRSNGVTVTGAQSVVENLTVRNHLANGVLFTGVTDERLRSRGGGGHDYDPLDTVKFPALAGFRASYVTAYNNALYGIYAFDARNGVIEHSYASGHADSGIYVGQCRPCATVVRHNTVERNAVGMEVTNASRELYFLGNTIRSNRVGLTVNSNDIEALAPQHGAFVVGNTITANNASDTPQQADGGFGIGIGVGGGAENLFERNAVTGNRTAGVLLTDAQGYPVRANTVRGNRVTGNGTDLALRTDGGTDNCFSGNGESTTAPRGLAEAAGCGTAGGGGRVPEGASGPVPPPVAAPPGLSFKRVVAPQRQPSLPGAATESPAPAVGLPGTVRLADFPLPGQEAEVPRQR
ncbi:right-handed parallel beta-helix repeat-containing protein [Streptomyces sp. NPDC093224]|uniref:right-handed parallel beta-helix repeat-containing protein n=1 Tax=Streptomyces sp. NPDC093224 TaxID=3155198 RepID=UPI00341A08AE